MYRIHTRAVDDYDVPFKICPNCGARIYDGWEVYVDKRGEIWGCEECMSCKSLEIDPDDENVGWE